MKGEWTMQSWKLFYLKNEISEIHSVSDLENILRNIHKYVDVDNPILGLKNPNGDALTIGISHNVGFLDYMDSSRNVPYYSSVGNPSLTLEDGCEIFDCGEATDIPRRNCIDFNTLIDVVKEFYHTGKLSESIEWEED